MEPFPAERPKRKRRAGGSVRAVTSDEGLANETDLYRPFGEQVETILSVNAVREAKGYIGERYDADAGLLYLNARYYDPRLGMFTQPDWWEVTQAGVGTNRFAYSFNDPINGRDPGGNGIRYYDSDGDGTNDSSEQTGWDGSQGTHGTAHGRTRTAAQQLQLDAAIENDPDMWRNRHSLGYVGSDISAAALGIERATGISATFSFNSPWTLGLSGTLEQWGPNSLQSYLSARGFNVRTLELSAEVVGHILFSHGQYATGSRWSLGLLTPTGISKQLLDGVNGLYRYEKVFEQLDGRLQVGFSAPGNIGTVISFDANNIAHRVNTKYGRLVIEPAGPNSHWSMVTAFPVEKDELIDEYAE